ncbi:MAG TPA: basic amino acid ABC transporter substrate-binding protein [Syntrophaceticus sp.]|jgi:glutamine transport system substrate-binding protein|nr:basic amino acid ABC transporter substrate-binding protein [Syntrophaceticus sp.]
MSLRKVFRYLLIVMLIGLFGAFGVGCSSDNNNGTPAAGDKDTKEKPKYTVAFEATFAPLEFRDEKTGEFTGFDIELIKAIGEVEGFDVELKDMGFDGIVSSVKTGNIDIGASGLTIDEDRLESVDFSTPYYKAGLSVVVRANEDKIKSVKDLKGKKIAVQIGTTGSKYAKTIEGANVTDFDQVTDALMEVKNGGADALVNDNPVNQYYVSKSKKDYKIVGDILESEYYGIAVKKGNTELLEKINNGLKKLKESGEYAKLYKKWFGEEPPEFLPGEEEA